jgi:hypothetical protein
VNAESGAAMEARRVERLSAFLKNTYHGGTEKKIG